MANKPKPKPTSKDISAIVDRAQANPAMKGGKPGKRC